MRSMSVVVMLGLLLGVACSDHGLQGLGPTPTPSEGATPIPLPLCGEQLDLGWQWRASSPFDSEQGLVDTEGRSFWETDFLMNNWQQIALPDDGHIPAGSDRIYRSTFQLGTLPEALYLSVQSDDGLWLWLNGSALGHWGGDWQQEGCVNDDAGCAGSQDVAPIDVSNKLAAGANVLAARVSNPLVNGYFDLYPACD